MASRRESLTLMLTCPLRVMSKAPTTLEAGQVQHDVGRPYFDR